MTIFEWIRNREIRGRVTFSVEELKQAFSEKSYETIKSELTRLAKKGYVSSVYRGFYVVVPVQYQLKGIVPPTYYIDKLMQYEFAFSCRNARGIASGCYDNSSDYRCAKNQVFFKESVFELELSQADTRRTTIDKECRNECSALFQSGAYRRGFGAVCRPRWRLSNSSMT